jgi:hypothetical protein
MVVLTNTCVRQPLQPFDDEDDRNLMKNYRIKDAKQQSERGHGP